MDFELCPPRLTMGSKTLDKIIRMSDFPEEYRDGYVLFCGQKVVVDQRALIPRLETEELVKYAL
jgi:methylase of polypeptide subunit release factors